MERFYCKSCKQVFVIHCLKKSYKFRKLGCGICRPLKLQCANFIFYKLNFMPMIVRGGVAAIFLYDISSNGKQDGKQDGKRKAKNKS